MGSSVTLGSLDHPCQDGVGFALPTLGPSQPTSDRQLTQYMDRGGSGDTGHLVGGCAFPDSVLLLDEGVEDEAAVPIHLGTALPHTAHLRGMDMLMGGHHQPTPVQVTLPHWGQGDWKRETGPTTLGLVWKPRGRVWSVF